MQNPIVATYRIVTQMFLGGAQPGEEAELRLPSFKGALRFWWRALRWGEVESLEQLRTEEADLFGSSFTGQSRVRIWMSNAVTPEKQCAEKWKPSSWQGYVGYGLTDKGSRWYLKPGQDFSVFVDLERCSHSQIQQVLAALKLLGLAGGLGARSRRGWGSITLMRLEGDAWTCPRSQDEWERAIAELKPKAPVHQPPYTALWRDCVWAAGPPQHSCEKAHEWLASRYRARVKDCSPKHDRAQFGLPRPFRDRPRKERRASPLFLHVHQCPGGQCLPCALWLPADFLESDPRIPGRGAHGRSFVEELKRRDSTPRA
ncbi:type III-B CRISPR module RAMP protein Cmr1 [Limisphaera sp. VF-2]|jgi:CRISPR-associated protein Cmr1|uniref:type III-B CRISPR module RAMP protein Cmr1 n=1 Tax=Limisphaera sp. VF-2 TaxID=3400418 RepID=UPI0017756422